MGGKWARLHLVVVGCQTYLGDAVGMSHKGEGPVKGEAWWGVVMG